MIDWAREDMFLSNKKLRDEISSVAPSFILNANISLDGRSNTQAAAELRVIKND